MPKRKAPLEIGFRAFEEVDRIFDLAGHGNAKRATKAIGCRRKGIYDWKYGSAPDAIFLSRLHAMGADVIYILSGYRQMNLNKEGNDNG